MEATSGEGATVEPAAADIGADAEGAADGAAMDAGNRAGGERPPDDSVRL
jgi:hypothetical protein